MAPHSTTDVNPPARTVEDFLTHATVAPPGWSEDYGGPRGVIAEADRLQEGLRRQTREVAAVRAAALEELVRRANATAVAGDLGISLSAVYRSGKRPAAPIASW